MIGNLDHGATTSAVNAITAPLPTFQLPLIPGGPPDGFGWEQREFSDLSRTTAFIAGINERDKFLGRNRHSGSVSRGAIGFLKRRKNVQNMNRAMAFSCVGTITVHLMNIISLYVFSPMKQVRKFVFINHSRDEDFQEFHGKAIALDNRDRYAPFPSLFIIHEMRVRGRHPFQPSDIDLPDDIPWQQRISAGGVYNDVSDSFNRRAPPGSRSGNVSARPLPQTWRATKGTGDTLPGGRRITLNADVIAEILAATRASPSWKACKMEGISWDGTAEENIQKYVSSIGVQDSQESGPEDPKDD
ncbi:hypothetical protein A7U60_g6502 [Sanghuangporus baumii]|uniref:Uncharacterized protein n=1 Tax=Sanghuangporus baumii TaxID=108892 RepID=A0A9Q5HV11_SANBA|nr:hypothetical protein A7U60_g6502 [Sanghuangporus baumii]